MLVIQAMQDRYRTVIWLKIASIDSQKEIIVPQNFQRTNKESLRRNAYVSYLIFILYLFIFSYSSSEKILWYYLLYVACMHTVYIANITSWFFKLCILFAERKDIKN